MSFAALRKMIEHRPEWKPSRLKFALLRNDGGVWGEDFDEEGMVVLRSTEVAVDGEWRISDPAKRRLSARDQRAGLLLEGDLLVTKSSGSEDHLGKTALVSKEVAALQAAFSNFMQRLRVSQKQNPRYYYYLLNSYVGREYLCCLGSTTTGLRNLSGGVLAELAISGPSLSEQTQIAKFLDYETLRIDALIEKQQQLIALLKEKRQAVISHAVTKGLNPDAPMRDSGVEWLGEVPAHWEVLPTKRLFSLECHPAPKNNDMELLSVYTHIGVRPRKDLEQKGNKASTTDGYWIVKKGDLIVNKLLAWMGAVGYSDYDGVTSPAYDILRKIQPLHPKFYHYLFRLENTGYEFKRWSRGIMEMRLRLYFEELGKIQIPLPSEHEQNKIVAYIEGAEATFDGLALMAEDQIALLQERRTALISAAVTGKIDVRSWKAPEPQTHSEVL